MRHASVINIHYRMEVDWEGEGGGTDEGEKTMRCPLNGLDDGELIGRGDYY